MDELTEPIAWLEAQKLDKPLVHIIDWGADSVAHLRSWSHSGWNWLIRVKEGSRVCYGGNELKLRDVTSELTFTQAREVMYKGRLA